MAEKEEDKFIVLNTEKLLKLLDKHGIEIENGIFTIVKGEEKSWVKMVQGFIDLLGCFEEEYGEKQYVVCNQDEPYAEEVWQVILQGEDAKRKKRGA